MGSSRSSSTRKFVKGTLIHRKTALRGLRRHNRSSKTRYVMIAHGVIVPSHHTTVDVDIHSLCDFCVRGRSEVSVNRGLQNTEWVDEPSGTCSKNPSTFDVFGRQCPLIRWGYTVSDCTCTLSYRNESKPREREENRVSGRKHGVCKDMRRRIRAIL